MFTQSLTIPNALRLPEQSVNALLRGEIVAAIPRTFTNVGKTFALYPDRPDANAETVTIEAWARCELCDIIDASKPLEIISRHISMPTENLQEMIAERESFFLAYLRVYRLPKPISIPATSKGQYIALPDRIQVDELSPLLSDRDFARLKQQLEKLEPPEPLDVQIQRMLEEVELQRKIELSKELNWVKTITTLGDRSIELEEKKTTYQAGTDFENIAKHGLEFLGFTIDYSHKGGAGGLDLLCLKPYPLFGECKAGKSIPNDTVVQLLNLGTIRNNNLFQKADAVKLIIGSGNPTPQVLDGAYVHNMAIINPITLQKLVELKAKYDGAINLFELKKYLQAGQVNDKIDEYIQKVECEIKLRSHIVQAVKELQETNPENSSSREIRTQYNANNKSSILDVDTIREILIELSSPLAGYLGRVEENGKKCDRFYFLRDLTCD
jgi:Domain of unknown function (DUF1802)